MPKPILKNGESVIKRFALSVNPDTNKRGTYFITNQRVIFHKMHMMALIAFGAMGAYFLNGKPQYDFPIGSIVKIKKDRWRMLTFLRVYTNDGRNIPVGVKFKDAFPQITDILRQVHGKQIQPVSEEEWNVM